MISALLIAWVSFVAVFAVWMLILFVSMALADTGYVGKHR